MTDDVDAAAKAERLKRDIEVLIAIGRALETLPTEAQRRVLRAVATLYDVRLT